jgi:hypothetical protein
MEISMEVPQENKNGTYDPVISLLGIQVSTH